MKKTDTAGPRRGAAHPRDGGRRGPPPRAALGRGFLEAVRLLAECRGKAVLTGVGKSGLIAKKVAATLASTGTTAVFLHATEAAHGDLGVITPEDVVVAFSASGETEEILRLVLTLRQIGVPIVAVTRERGSRLGEAG